MPDSLKWFLKRVGFWVYTAFVLSVAAGILDFIIKLSMFLKSFLFYDGPQSFFFHPIGLVILLMVVAAELASLLFLPLLLSLILCDILLSLSSSWSLLYRKIWITIISLTMALLTSFSLILLFNDYPLHSHQPKIFLIFIITFIPIVLLIKRKRLLFYKEL